ncbi:MAG TPA: spermidine/putrescine ABC transporter substrate-binding protein [Tissierellaceae bacterium]|nr:spermidine/putrescine ABC transporter substrate-binding protein [Tissierellaceae bacterium]
MKNSKLIILLVLVSTMLIFAAACGDDRPTINVYNWGDYIDSDVIKDFEDEFGIKVNYSMFETNEDMYIKLKQGGSSYDLVIPSDYMIARMIREDMLSELNLDNIPNIAKVDEDLLNPEYDPDNKYSVPYMWGTVGILYNTTMVDDVVDSWDILWDEKYADQIIMLNSQRDSIAVSLKRLGYSMNSRDLAELEEAKDELIKQKPLVYAYLGDQVKDTMIAGDAALAVVYSGDAEYLIRENPDLAYAFPKEGFNLWFDSMVIPNSAKNKEGAEEFINFMTRPDIAARNAEYIGYSSPIPEAIELLSEDLKNSDVAYPDPEIIENTEVFIDLSDVVDVYDRVWTELNSY